MKPETFSPAQHPPRRRVVTHPLTWMRVVRALLDLGGPDCELCQHTEHDWASATFVGSRHTVTLRFTGYAGLTAAEDFMIALPDHEFTLPGQIVADATILAVDEQYLPRPRLTLTCDLLLVEDR